MGETEVESVTYPLKSFTLFNEIREEVDEPVPARPRFATRGFADIAKLLERMKE
jgi:hypothetical protein